MTQLRAKARSFGRLPAGAQEHPGAPGGRRHAVREAGRQDGRAAGVRHFAATRWPCAKVLNEFAKGNEKFVIKAGAMPNAGDVRQGQSRRSPRCRSREELLAKLLGTMQAPIAKLVRTLNEVPGKFVRTLAAVRDAKQAGRLIDSAIATQYPTVIQEQRHGRCQTEILEEDLEHDRPRAVELIKDMEEKFGVSAAAAVAVAGPAAGGAAAAAAEEQTEFTVMLDRRPARTRSTSSRRCAR